MQTEQKPSTDNFLLWGCLSMIGIGGLFLGLNMWAASSLGNSDLGATLPYSWEEKEAIAKEDARFEARVRQNFEQHKKEFNLLAKQYLAQAVQTKQTRTAINSQSALKKMQIQEVTARKERGEWRVEFVVKPKNDFGMVEEAYTGVNALYVYSVKEPAEMADNGWKYNFRLTDKWYFFLRAKSSDVL